MFRWRNMECIAEYDRIQVSNMEEVPHQASKRAHVLDPNYGSLTRVAMSERSMVTTSTISPVRNGPSPKSTFEYDSKCARTCSRASASRRIPSSSIDDC